MRWGQPGSRATHLCLAGRLVSLFLFPFTVTYNSPIVPLLKRQIRAFTLSRPSCRLLACLLAHPVTHYSTHNNNYPAHHDTPLNDVTTCLPYKYPAPSYSILFSQIQNALLFRRGAEHRCRWPGRCRQHAQPSRQLPCSPSSVSSICECTMGQDANPVK